MSVVTVILVCVWRMALWGLGLGIGLGAVCGVAVLWLGTVSVLFVGYAPGFSDAPWPEALVNVLGAALVWIPFGIIGGVALGALIGPALGALCGLALSALTLAFRTRLHDRALRYRKIARGVCRIVPVVVLAGVWSYRNFAGKDSVFLSVNPTGSFFGSDVVDVILIELLPLLVAVWAAGFAGGRVARGLSE